MGPVWTVFSVDVAELGEFYFSFVLINISSIAEPAVSVTT
jgi:hypothetical protein